MNTPYTYHANMENDQTNLNISFYSINGQFTIFVFGSRSGTLIHCITDELGVDNLASTGIYYYTIPGIDTYNPITGISGVNKQGNIRIKIRYTIYLGVVDILLIVGECKNLYVAGSES